MPEGRLETQLHNIIKTYLSAENKEMTFISNCICTALSHPLDLFETDKIYLFVLSLVSHNRIFSPF